LGPNGKTPALNFSHGARIIAGSEGQDGINTRGGWREIENRLDRMTVLPQMAYSEKRGLPGIDHRISGEIDRSVGG